MPTPRRYASPAERQAAYRQRVAAAHQQELQAKGMPPLPRVASMPGTGRWAAMHQQALWLLQRGEEEMRDYYDQRAEGGEGSERGRAGAERRRAREEAIAAVEAHPAG